VTAVSFQGPSKDFALHTIGWQAFQDLAVSIAESEFSRTVSRVAKNADEGRDGFFYGVPDERLKRRDKRQTTIQCKHLSTADAKLTVAKLREEFTSVSKLVASHRAHGYILMTNASVTEGDRKRIVAALEKCGVAQPYVHGRDWIVAKILEHPRVRALVPRIYGLGDLSWITDKKARDQAEAIIGSMGDDLACYVPTKAHRDAVRALDAHRFVLLLGDPAVGKSTIAAALSVAATDQGQCEVNYVRNPEEFISSWNPDIENRLFGVDDAFGSIQYAPELTDRWNKVFQTIKAAIKRKNRFILTSRTYIWRQARADLKSSAFPAMQNGSVVVDVEKLTEPEKERILYNHLKFGKQPRAFLLSVLPFLEAVVASPHFRPEIVRRLGDPAFTGNVNPTSRTLDAFFRYPERFLEETISKLEISLKAAIGLIFLGSGRLPRPIVDDDAAKLIRGSFGVSAAKLKTALESMKGSFVNDITEDEETYWTYKHPTIADAYASIVGQHEELIDIYIRGTKLTQILREARCGVGHVQGASVAIGASQYQLLLDRFAEAEDLPDSDVRRFLIERCGPKFFKMFHHQFHDTFPWGGSLSRPASRDDQARLVLKAGKLGVLPEDVRTVFVTRLARVITNDADIGFLEYDRAFNAFLTDDEREYLLSLAKADFVENLQSAIEAEGDAWESGWDPDDWFIFLRGSIDTLERLFPEDEDVRLASDEAREAIAHRVRNIKERAAEEEENDDGDHHVTGAAAISTGVRSIFDDLV
jgi:energy-coupling factor transporter ATP-binding protein EcfA2